MREDYYLSEQNVYASSRIGMIKSYMIKIGEWIFNGNFTGDINANVGHTDESFSATYNHEIAHYAAINFGVIGDHFYYGYENIGISSEEQRSLLLKAIYSMTNPEARAESIEAYKEQKNLDKKTGRTVKKVEGGYVLEYLIFGGFIHRLPAYSK